MKICPRCKQEKKLNDFGLRSTAKDGRQTYCKICAVESRMESYYNNKDKESEYRKNIKKRNQKLLQEYKSSRPCTDCKQNYPYYVLDFDHLHSKKYNVSQMLTLSWGTILNEIEKCDLVCANCHRKRTYSRLP